MPSLSSPWFHQRQAPVSQTSRESAKTKASLTGEEFDQLNRRLSKPTEASRAKSAMHWKTDDFMDRGRHSWAKMELFEDCKKCMWTPAGSLKGSCKIRPTYVYTRVIHVKPA